MTLFSQKDEISVLKYYDRSNIDSVTKHIQRFIKDDESLKKEDVLNYYFTYSRILKQIGKIDSSFYFLNKVKPVVFKSKSKDSILLYYCLKVELARFNGNKYLTDETILDSEQFFVSNKNHQFNSDILAYYLNRKAASFNNFHFSSKDTLNLILNLSEQVVKLENQVSDKSIIAYSLNEIGQVYLFYIDKDKGLEYYNRAYLYAKNQNLNVPLADIAMNLARYHERYGNLKEAAIIQEEAFSVVENTDNLWQALNISGHLGAIYSQMGDYKNAYKYRSIEFDKRNELEKLRTTNLLKDAEYNLKLENQTSTIKSKNLEVKKARQYLMSLIILIMLIILGTIILFLYNKRIKKANKELEVLSEENKFLLSEANHRINNNLQLVIILISDQIKKQSPEQQTEIRNILSKVDSIATLHRHLYRNSDKTKINSESYLREIFINFNEIFNENNIKVNFKVDEFLLPTDLAMYYGLLFTELCINSIKHAFSANQKEKLIAFKLVQIDEVISYEYSDNGENNIGREIEPKLIDKLCRQLKISYDINTKNGFMFSFKKELK